MSETVTAYKAFNKDWTCRGFKYEVGGIYKHDGNIEMCRSGFHACLSPFDCWSYYDLTDSKFAEVEVSSPTTQDGDTKVCSAEIHIKAELALPDFIKRGVQWLVDATRGKDETGYNAQIGSSGDWAQIGSSGDDARIGSTGDWAQIGSSGYNARIGSTGYNAQIGSSGDWAQIGSSGYNARIGSTGDWAQIGSSGDWAKIEATGEQAVIASAGFDARAKGAVGTWVSLAEFEDGECVGFATGCIGRDGLKPDTWYEARGGKLVEVE